MDEDDLTLEEMEELLGSSSTQDDSDQRVEDEGSFDLSDFDVADDGSAADSPGNSQAVGGGLSQDEIDALLMGGGESSASGLFDGNSDGGSGGDSAGASQCSTSVLSQDDIDQVLGRAGKDEPEGPMIRIYDFKRPDTQTGEDMKDHQKHLERFCEKIISAENMDSFLDKVVRTKAYRFQVASVDQLTYEEFIRSVPALTLIGSFGIGDFPERGVLQFDTPYGRGVLESLLGFPVADGADDMSLAQELWREGTASLTVVRSLWMALIQLLEEVWFSMFGVTLAPDTFMTNPHFVDAMHSGHMIVLGSIEIVEVKKRPDGTEDIPEHLGMMKICIPGNALKSIRARA